MNHKFSLLFSNLLDSLCGFSFPSHKKLFPVPQCISSSFLSALIIDPKRRRSFLRFNLRSVLRFSHAQGHTDLSLNLCCLLTQRFYPSSYLFHLSVSRIRFSSAEMVWKRDSSIARNSSVKSASVMYMHSFLCGSYIQER